MAEYITKFDEYVMRCNTSKFESVTLSRFRAGLHEDIQRKFYFKEVNDLEQAYQVTRNCERFQRTPTYHRPEPFRNPSRTPGSSQAYSS